jgi:hypothetical protein
MITFNQFRCIAEAHLINTDPHDDYDIETTDKLGPNQTTFKHKKTGIHVSYAHAGKDQHGRDVHTVAWRHPESENPNTKATLSHQEKVRIARHGIRALKDTSHRAPKGSVVHNNPTKDEGAKSSDVPTRSKLYHKLGWGHSEYNKDTEEHDQYGEVGEKGKISPLKAKGMKVSPEAKRDAESEHKPKSTKSREDAAKDAKAHEREMRRQDAIDRRNR